MIDQIRPFAGFDYIQNSNPTIDVNPNALGKTWLNMSTGEIFVCTDATIDSNIWKGTSGKRVSDIPTDCIYLNGDSGVVSAVGTVLLPATTNESFALYNQGYADFGNIADIALGVSITFSFWFFPLPAAVGTDIYIMSKGQSLSSELGYSLIFSSIDASTTTVGARCYDGTTKAGYRNIVTNNCWSHLFLEYNRNTNVVLLYVNNSLENGSEGAYGASSNDMTSIGSCSTPDSLYFGSDDGGIQQGSYIMRRLRIFDRALSETERENLSVEHV